MIKKTIANVLDSRFGDEKIKWFQQSDHHHNLEGDTYLRFKMSGEKVELFLGGDNGEMCVLVTGDPEKLDLLITLLLFG